MTKHLLVLFSLLTIGCEAQTRWDRGTVLTPETSLGAIGTADWTIEIQKAIDLWQEHLGPECEFPFSIGEGGYPVRLVAPKDWVWGDDTNGIQEEDYIEIEGGHPYDKVWVLAHELGHALDLWHNEESGTLMFEITGRRFVEAEVAQVRADYCP